jgi:DHA1 family bicyclomycin/chloramphenicol resistance-like MFS transporter
MSASHNRIFIIVILGALATISPFAIDMYLPAFPEVAAALHTSTARVQLSIVSYFAGFSIGQLIYGPLLDRFGRKRPLYVGLALYVVASIFCMVSANVKFLIAMRFIQAIGGCSAGVAGMAMVRDFFHVDETAKIISILILILSVSPFLAPSVGHFVAEHFGWRWVFVLLAAFSLLMLVVCRLCLPEGHTADVNVSLKLMPVVRNYAEVLKEPQFLTYALSGSFAFSGLLVYVSSSPIIFMEVFHVNGAQFSWIFATMAVGFIGANQVNVFLLRKFSSAQIFYATLLVECPVVLMFLVGTYFNWLGLPAVLVLLFIVLSSLGLAYPNAAALSVVPFDHNIGSASAMLGFLQIGIAVLASSLIGLTNSHTMTPVALIVAVTSWIGLVILLIGKRRIHDLRFVEEKDANFLQH